MDRDKEILDTSKKKLEYNALYNCLKHYKLSKM